MCIQPFFFNEMGENMIYDTNQYPTSSTFRKREGVENPTNLTLLKIWFFNSLDKEMSLFGDSFCFNHENLGMLPILI